MLSGSICKRRLARLLPHTEGTIGIQLFYMHLRTIRTSVQGSSAYLGPKNIPDTCAGALRRHRDRA